MSYVNNMSYVNYMNIFMNHWKLKAFIHNIYKDKFETSKI